MSERFKLPVSSYEELVKIVRAYATGKEGTPISLAELEKASGIGRTTLSKNNGFLVCTGIITEGAKKAPTSLCMRLARALSMTVDSEIRKIWSNIISDNDFLTKLLLVVNIKGGISREDYLKHIMFSAECNNSTAHKTGAATIIEILKVAGEIVEKDGSILPGTLSEKDCSKEGKNSEEKSIALNNGTDETLISEMELSFYVQQYTCESGKIAKFIIPEDATEDDLLGFRDTLQIALKRKFKLKDV